jgi:L,D-transpeptidase catalytic domain
MVMSVRSYALLTVAAVGLLPGCGGAADSVERGGALAAQVARCTPVAFEHLGTPTRAFGAAARRRLGVHDVPGGRVVERFGRLNANRVPTVFGIVGRAVDRGCATWYRVRLPRKPNGRLGWVQGRDVTLGRVRTRILVDLSERLVVLYRDGRRLLQTRAAIGSSATPTPVGSFYVDQRLLAADPKGPFGPGAVGIAAYSNVLTGWAQGGPIAIHGTNRPELIGRAVSNGCLRVRNDVLLRIFRATLAGTPVRIQR